ncbi:hypothetical protein [Massilia varians]|uniref:hypothetical protein n=1 Tax=Massilia varians TaxID=457921 RepID=UPI002552A280|nr:hypothetical protein [Massilia varians]MDK6076018.1 hypothetical protein [Massilia varians]
MNTTPHVSRRLTAALTALALAGCAASTGAPPHGEQQAGSSTAATAIPPSGPFYGLETTTGGSAAGSATRHSGDEATCAMDHSMGDAPKDEARRAMEERRLQGMSPEQRRQHLEMMRRHCP